MNAQTETLRTVAAIANIDISAIMRAERIRNIGFDWMADSFTVMLLDCTTGYGSTVGEALADAKRRAG